MPQLSLPPNERVDDVEAIPGKTNLWRLVDPDAIKTDAQTKKLVPSDGDLRSHEISVRLKTATFDLANLKSENPGAAVAQFSADQARAAGCIVTLDRREFGGSHAFIYRKDEPGKRLSPGQAAQLARSCQII